MLKKFLVLLGLATTFLVLTACGVDLEGDDKTIDPTNTVQVADQIQWETTAVPQTDDELFIATLDEFDVYYSNETTAVEMGNLICETLATTYVSDEALVNQLYMATADSDYNFTMQDMANLFTASVSVYCPWESA